LLLKQEKLVKKKIVCMAICAISVMGTSSALRFAAPGSIPEATPAPIPDATLKAGILDSSPHLIALVQAVAPENNEVLKSAMGFDDQYIRVARSVTPEELKQALADQQRQATEHQKRMAEAQAKWAQEDKQEQEKQQMAQERYLANKQLYDNFINHYAKAAKTFFEQFKKSLSKAELALFEELSAAYSKSKSMYQQDQEALKVAFAPLDKAFANNPSAKSVLDPKKPDTFLFLRLQAEPIRSMMYIF
jgi:hypothetical protein